MKASYHINSTDTNNKGCSLTVIASIYRKIKEVVITTKGIASEKIDYLSTGERFYTLDVDYKIYKLANVYRIIKKKK